MSEQQALSQNKDPSLAGLDPANLDSKSPSHDLELIITDSAANKVYELLEDENNPETKLRAYIMGGGCSGFQYGFMFDDQVAEDDTLIVRSVLFSNSQSVEVEDEEEGGSSAAGSAGQITVIVDALSLQYLEGATIDYREDANGAQFVVHNPNAKTTCGCGSSFTI